MIFENIQQIAREKGISIGLVERECNLANGTIGKWREASPNAINLKKVADYLGTTVDSLLHGVDAR